MNRKAGFQLIGTIVQVTLTSIFVGRKHSLHFYISEGQGSVVSVPENYDICRNSNWRWLNEFRVHTVIYF